MKIPYQDKMVDAKEVEVLTSNEPWNEYQLANGNVLMTKTVLVRVFEAATERTPSGEPLYLTNTQTIVKVRVPEK